MNVINTVYPLPCMWLINWRMSHILVSTCCTNCTNQLCNKSHTPKSVLFDDDQRYFLMTTNISCEQSVRVAALLKSRLPLYLISPGDKRSCSILTILTPINFSLKLATASIWFYSSAQANWNKMWIYTSIFAEIIHTRNKISWWILISNGYSIPTE